MKKVKSTQTLNCKICGEEVHNVGHDTVKVTCSKCVSLSMQTTVLPANEEDND